MYKISVWSVVRETLALCNTIDILRSNWEIPQNVFYDAMQKASASN